MRNTTRRVIQTLLAGTLLLLVIQVVLVAPRVVRESDDKDAPVPVGPIASSPVDQSLHGMHMVETQERMKWELWADQAESLKAKDLLRLVHVKALFFAQHGVTFTVTGDRGIVHVKSKNLRVEGSVVTKTSNGYVFNSDDLNYDSKTRTLSTDSKVTVWGPRERGKVSLRLSGTGMNAPLDEGTMDILKDVHARKKIENGRTAYIKSDRSRFSAKDRSALFEGNVVLDLDTMRITGPQARFDYDKSSDIVRSITVDGGARVSDTDKWATSKSLKIDFHDDRFVLTGSPRVVQNNDELRGEKIVFLDGGKRVQVFKARATVDEKRLEKKE